VLLIAVLIVGGLVWLFVAQPWRGDPTAGPAPSPSASTAAPSTDATGDAEDDPDAADADGDAEPDPEETPAAEACRPGDVIVEAVTDSSSYDAGQDPQLSIRLLNRSEADCSLNVGTSVQEFTVSSGDDVWWRSTDCQSEPSDMIVLLAAGQEVSSAEPLAWDRTRSSVDTCDSDRPQAPGGGATFSLSVSIAGIVSTNTATFQLN
jgi:hypothetical protein